MKKLIAVPGSNEAAPVDYQLEISADVLARTIWGEARGEGAAGMQAVAAVVMNRVRVARERGTFWWGNDVVGVCQKPFQFSCWNKDDANFLKVLNVDQCDLVFATAARLGFRAVIGQLADPTRAATHYHAVGIMPKWAAAREPTAIIGRHVFYRIV